MDDKNSSEPSAGGSGELRPLDHHDFQDVGWEAFQPFLQDIKQLVEGSNLEFDDLNFNVYSPTEIHGRMEMAVTGDIVPAHVRVHIDPDRGTSVSTGGYRWPQESTEPESALRVSGLPDDTFAQVRRLTGEGLRAGQQAIAEAIQTRPVASDAFIGRRRPAAASEVEAPAVSDDLDESFVPTRPAHREDREIARQLNGPEPDPHPRR